MGIRSKFHQFYPKRKSLAKNLLNKMSEHCFHPLLIHLPCPLSIFSQTGDFIYIIVDVISNWDICCKFSFRGFTEENTKLGIISPIGYYKSPNEDILSNWRLGHCSLTPLYLTQKFPNSNWVYYPQFGICFNQLGMLCPVGIFNKSAHLADSVIVLRCLSLCLCVVLKKPFQEVLETSGQ